MATLTTGGKRFNAILAGLRALAYTMDRAAAGKADVRDRDILQIARDHGDGLRAHEVESLGDELNDNRLILRLDGNDGRAALVLTFAEWQIIAFDLRTAADQYTADAKAALSTPTANHRLAEQFITQAQRSITLAERIEESEGV